MDSTNKLIKTRPHDHGHAQVFGCHVRRLKNVPPKIHYIHIHINENKHYYHNLRSKTRDKGYINVYHRKNVPLKVLGPVR